MNANSSTVSSPSVGVEVVPRTLVGPDLADPIAAIGDQMAADLILQQLLADRAHAASGMSS